MLGRSSEADTRFAGGFRPVTGRKVASLDRKRLDAKSWKRGRDLRREAFIMAEDGSRIYAFTLLDVFSRWAYARIEHWKCNNNRERLRSKHRSAQREKIQGTA